MICVHVSHGKTRAVLPRVPLRNQGCCYYAMNHSAVRSVLLVADTQGPGSRSATHRLYRTPGVLGVPGPRSSP